MGDTTLTTGLSQRKAWHDDCALNPGRFGGGRKVSRQVAIAFTFPCHFINYALATFTFAPTLP